MKPKVAIEHNPIMANNSVMPLCPICGLVLMWPDWVWVKYAVGELIPVECSCGWKGLSTKEHKL